MFSKETSEAIGLAIAKFIEAASMEYVSLLPFKVIPEDITSTISFKTQWFVDKYSQIHAVGDPPLHEESYENMKKRVSDAFEEYLANMQTNVLVIVTHLIPLEIMTQIMTNENTRLRDDGFCCVTMASFAENKFKVFFQADHTHAPQYIRN